LDKSKQQQRTSQKPRHSKSSHLTPPHHLLSQEVGDVYEVGVCVYLGFSLIEKRPSSLCLYILSNYTLSQCVLILLYVSAWLEGRRRFQKLLMPSSSSCLCLTPKPSLMRPSSSSSRSPSVSVSVHDLLPRVYVSVSVLISPSIDGLTAMSTHYI
jgi:hypothetical protein